MPRDHKDITDYRRLGPPIEIPAHLVRRLTAHECRVEADRCDGQAKVCVSPTMRRYLQREAHGWRQLARERSRELAMPLLWEGED
jgi:hypothetical protein